MAPPVDVEYRFKPFELELNSSSLIVEDILIDQPIISTDLSKGLAGKYIGFAPNGIDIICHVVEFLSSVDVDAIRRVFHVKREDEFFIVGPQVV